MDVKDMPLFRSTPITAPSLTQNSKQAPALLPTTQTEPRTSTGFHYAASLASPAACVSDTNDVTVLDTSDPAPAVDDPAPATAGSGWSRGESSLGQDWTHYFF